MEANAPIAEISLPRTPELARNLPKATGTWASFGRHAIQGILIAAVSLASYFFVGKFFLQSVRVTGVSMLPTLRHSQICFLNRWIYYVRGPARGDVVVLRDPSDGELAVKRIIGVPGDRVEFKAGAVFLNGKKLRESYLRPGTQTYPGPDCKEQSFACGSSQFVVLGDNRMNSADSRNYGPVQRARILGQIR